MKKTLLLLALLASSAFCDWTESGRAPTMIFSNLGCGPDSGKSFLFVSFGNTPSYAYMLKSDSPLFESTLAMVERGLADQLPVTLYVRSAESSPKYNYLDDAGVCSNKQWPEILGASLSKR